MGGGTEGCNCTVAMGGGTGSCSSCAANESVSYQPRRRMQKFEAYREVLRRLRVSENEEVSRPGFGDELCNHFDRLPSRYATDVNVEQPENVIMHMKLLHRAEDPTTRPAFEVRIVQVLVSDLNCGEFVSLNSKKNVDPQSSGVSTKLNCPPTFAFGLSPSLEVACEANKSNGQSGGDGERHFIRHFFEITFSTVDKPKLLSQLTSILSEIGLNIQEAHAFSTSDGYSLDVFLVDGWSCEETEQLKHVLEREIPKIEEMGQLKRVLEREIPKIEIEDVNSPDQRIASRLKIQRTVKALEEARARVHLLEKEHALALQEDLAIASAATSQQLEPEESILKDVSIRLSL